MSSHRATLEMIEDKIKSLKQDLGVAINNRNVAQVTLDRRAKDVTQLEYEIGQLEHTFSVLRHDANVEHVQVYPS